MAEKAKETAAVLEASTWWRRQRGGGGGGGAYWRQQHSGGRCELEAATWWRWWRRVHAGGGRDRDVSGDVGGSGILEAVEMVEDSVEVPAAEEVMALVVVGGCWWVMMKAVTWMKSAT